MSDKRIPRIVAVERSVAEIFSDEYRLELPYFQRGYAWKAVHALRLLLDVLNVAEGRREIDWYPLGEIIVAKEPDDPASWVADGHQRLITLTIIIASLRDLETTPARKARLDRCIARTRTGGEAALRLMTQEGARECLERFVQAPDGTKVPWPDTEDDPSESEENIIANRDVILGKLREIGRARQRRLADFLLDDCLFLVTAVRDQRIAQFLFATMHDTGLKPSDVDLFKAQVLGRVPVEARESCQATWENLEARVGLSGFDQLLQHIAELSIGDSLEEPAQSVLTERFDLRTPAAAASFVEETLRGAGTSFGDLTEAPFRDSPFAPSVCRRLQYLSWVRNHDTWMVPLLRWIQVNGPGHQDTPAFLRRLEALAWMHMITTVEPTPRHKRYMRLLAEIDAGTAVSGGGALAISGDERQKIRRTLTQPNYTNRSYKVFLLLRANAAIDGDDAIQALPEATIEHIYPRRPAASSQWVKDFRTPQDAARFRNCLGNVTLLTRPEQDRTKNYDFAVKRPVLAGSAFALSRRLASQQAWRPDEVGRSTDEIIEILMRSWQLA